MREELWVVMLAKKFEEIKNLLEAISRGEYCCLRHGLPYVTVGLLAEQAFCELRLEIRLREGLIAAPKASNARILVEAILKAKRVLPREPPGEFAASMPLASLVDGVAVVGRPHAVVFSEAGVEALVVGKMSSNPSRIYDSDRVRLYTYSLLARRIGLPVKSSTRLVLVSAKTPEALVEALEDIRARGWKPRAYKGEAYVHVLAADPEREEAIVRRLLAYWRGERSAEARRGKWCGSCPYRELCGAF